MFGESIFQQIVLGLRVDLKKRIAQKKEGGIQWVMEEEGVSLYGIRVMRNSPPEISGDRAFDWKPDLEAIPAGKRMLPPTNNMRDFEKCPWPFDPSDRPRERKAWWLDAHMTLLKELQRLRRPRSSDTTCATRGNSEEIAGEGEGKRNTSLESNDRLCESATEVGSLVCACAQVPIGFVPPEPRGPPPKRSKSVEPGVAPATQAMAEAVRGRPTNAAASSKDGLPKGPTKMTPRAMSEPLTSPVAEMSKI